MVDKILAIVVKYLPKVDCEILSTPYIVEICHYD